MIIVAGHFSVPPERRALFIDAAREVAAATATEAGCLFYEFWQDLEPGSGRYSLLEAWETEDHLKAHLGTPHIKAFAAKQVGMENTKIFSYEVANVKAL